NLHLTPWKPTYFFSPPSIWDRPPRKKSYFPLFVCAIAVGSNQLVGLRPHQVERRRLHRTESGRTKRNCCLAQQVLREPRNHLLREVSMKTLVIGLVITIVYLATYLVSTMERVW